MAVTIYDSEDLTLETGSTIGMVSSVDVSGGTSGLVFSGGPITGSGIITISSGTLTVPYGGTGLGTITAGRILYGAGSSALGNSANLFWDSANSRLGIGTASPPLQFYTTDRAAVATGVGTPANVSPIFRIGDLSYAWSGSWKYGLALSSEFTGLATSEGIYGAWIVASNNSAGVTPNHVVGTHTGAVSKQNITQVEALAAVAAVENSSGSMSVTSNMRAVFAGIGSSVAGGTRNITNGIGVWSNHLFSAGTNSMTNAIHFFADSSPTANYFTAAAGNFAAATAVNHIGFYSTAPTNGTALNRWGFYSEDKNSGASIAWNDPKFGFYQPTATTRAVSIPASPWGIAMAGPKSAFMGRVGIGTANPIVALDVCTDDSDGWDAIIFGTSMMVGGAINPSGVNASLLTLGSGVMASSNILLKTIRGSLAAPQNTQINQYLGGVHFGGYATSSGGYLSRPVQLTAFAEATWGAGGEPSGLIIGTGNGSFRNITAPACFDRTFISYTGAIRHYDQPYCRAYSTGQSIPDATPTALTFAAHDTGEQSTTARLGYPVHQVGVNPTRFTATYPGLYLFIGQVSFNANATGTRNIAARKGGTTYVGTTAVPTVTTGGLGTLIQVSGIVYLNSSEYIEFTAYQNSGAPLTVAAGNESTWGLLYKVA
jgi:hypothetical protein